MILEEIRTLLDAPPAGEGAPSLETVEHTLTTGYARALALEAERRRIERELTGLAGRLAGEEAPPDADEVAELGRRLSSADTDLTRLRSLLSSLRARANDLRAA